ncbi:MAG TPA: hypothetical protein VGF75_03170 [Candidatus Saccharimonadales bacterium]|jgi:isochorismate hydrolase
MANYVTQEGLDKSLDEALDKFAIKLIKHIDKSNKEIRQEVEKIDEKYDHLITTLDAFLGRLDNIEANDAARDVQLARHERWLEKIASKTGVKLEY